MSDEQKIKRLLEDCLYEIRNLQEKIANKESEGWEGSKRRLLLKEQLRAEIAALSPDVGSGI